MSNTKNFSLHIPNAQKKKMKQKVEKGHFPSQAEYIRHLIRKDPGVKS